MTDTQDARLIQGARERLGALRDLLAELGSVAVTYSGGVDSTFLATVAHDVLGERMAALTLAGHAAPARDIARTRDFCQERGIAHVVIEYDELTIPGFIENGPDRCYHCKKALFSRMAAEAEVRGISALVDGSNKDDEGDYRPGLRALEELGVRSPLREVGMTKAQIRRLSREMGLPTWDLPSAACLASRFAYHETITREKLARVEAAEDYLHDLGLTQLRVRVHGSGGELARIELAPDQIERIASPEAREPLVARFKELGFSYVSLDLQGFRSGAMNELL